MNREERRRNSRDVQREINQMRRDLKAQILQKVENERVEALLSCFVLALHEEYGFGQGRCMRALQKIDSYMEPYVSSRETVQELKNRVKDEVGIMIHC